MGDPFTALVAGAKAAGPLLSLLGGRLKRTEQELICGSFVAAIAEIRWEDHHADDAPGWLSRNARKVFRSREWFPAGGKNGPDVSGIKKGEERREHAGDGRRVATQLAQALITASADPSNQTQPKQTVWTEALRQFLEAAAKEGIESSRQDEQRAWWYVVAGDPDNKPNGSAVVVWATRMRAKVTAAWRKELAGLVIQLHHEDDYELTRALVVSSRDIAKSLWYLVRIAIPLALVGGGAIALLVLYIDKG
jgi:hypothetical protein